MRSSKKPMASLPIFFVSLIALQTLMLFVSTATEARPSFILVAGDSTSSTTISSYLKKTCYDYEGKGHSPPPPPPSHSPGPTPKLKSPPSSALRSPPPPPRHSPGPTPKLISPPNSLYTSETAASNSDRNDFGYRKASE